MLTLLSSYIVHVILAIGIIGFLVGLFLEFFPFVPSARLPILVVSAIVIGLGAWGEGVISSKKTLNQKVAEANAKVAAAEAKASKVNTEVQYVFQDRIQKVKDTKVVVQEKIKDVSVKIDSNCKITAETVDILNNAAKRPE